MQCPVCKINLDFEVPHLEEVYYDCSHCQSSLLFKNGQCEILSEGQPAKEEETILNEEPDSLIKEQDLSEQLEESSLKEQSEEVKEELVEFPLQEQSEKAQERPAESSLQEQETENQVLEEEFIPEETTQVPELPQEEESEGQQLQNVETKQQTPENLGTDAVRPEETEGSQEVSVGTEVQTSKKQTSIDSSKEDFREVAQFANTQSVDKQGAYLYDLILSEINSQPVREKVLSILEDEFLKLSLDERWPELKDSIKNGKVTISKISPVKAYVIITSLMGWPLNITWKQNHIADS